MTPDTQRQAASSGRLGGDGIRAFDPEDLPGVAELWCRVFRPRSGSEPPELRGYLRSIFLANPWADGALPSLVYERDGGVAGFLGVVPRPMLAAGRPVLAAVPSQFVVHPGARGGLVAVELLRRFFQGAQDLALADGATEATTRLWTRLGGEVARIQSLEWTRILRPACYAAGLLESRARVSPLVRACRIGLPLLDAAAGRLPRSPYRLPSPEGVVEAAGPDELLDCLERFSRGPVLRPRYDGRSLAWVLEMARHTRFHGDLRCCLVRAGAGEPAGWFAYFVRPGKVAQVLGLGGREAALQQVLEHLIRDAAERRAAAVSGQGDPQYLRQVSDCRGSFACRSLGVLVHSRSRELLDMIHRGDTLLTRLEGEWWLRFRDWME